MNSRPILLKYARLVIAYQELVGEGLDVAIVLAGLPGAIAATLNDKVLTFLNRAQKITLEPLSVTAVDAYFEQAFKQLGLNVSSDIRRKAAQATQGSPYFLQLIGHSIFQFCGMKKTVSEEDLANALYAAQSDFENDVCKTTLAALSDRDIDFLRAMAQDEGPSKMQEIAQRMGATPDYAQKYRKRLIDAGVIEVPVRGKVTFAVPHLADFLRSEEGMLY